MAIIQEGILGFAFGRVGPVTGYRRNGQNILRTSKNSGVVKSTAARVSQREKIKICNDFTGAFTGTGFFNKTFPTYGHAGSGYNRVTGCLMNLALVGTFPDQKLAWDKVLVARGALSLAENAVATKDSVENILFSWTDNSGTGTARSTDKVILVVYCTELKQAIFTTDAGQRGMGNTLLSATLFKHLTVATWIAFTNKEGDVSDSVFCGMLDL